MRRYQAVLSTLLLFGLLLMLGVGCSGGRKYEDLPMDAAWAKIMNYFDRGRYLDSIDYLELFLINYSGSALADSAQFMLAESHFKLKEYLIAASEYQKLMVQYPQSTLAEEGEYKMGLSYYKLAPKPALDQTYTEQAIETFQLFIEDYPESPLVSDATGMIEKARNKLAKKEYDSARLYHRMGESSSAQLYYDLVIENYYDTPYAALAQYHKASLYEKNKDWRDAIREYSNFLQKYPDHEYEARVLDNLNYAREQLTNEVTAEAEGDGSE